MAFLIRPRWLAIVALVVGLIPLFLLTAGISVTISDHEFNVRGWVKSLGMFGGLLHVISGAFSVVMLMGGVLIAVQRPRPGAHQCQSCLYDLSASEGDTCPECGKVDQARRLRLAASGRQA
jgi:hypothetical protein